MSTTTEEQRAYRRAYYQANKERANAYSKARYADMAKDPEWRREHTERMRAYRDEKAKDPAWRDKFNADARARFKRDVQALPKRESRFIDWIAVSAAFTAGADYKTVSQTFGITLNTLRTAYYRGRHPFPPNRKRGRPRTVNV